MPLTDWQAELGGVTIGAGTGYILDGPISGLGVPAPRTSDLDKGDQPGAFGGRDVPRVRTITIPVSMTGADPAATWELIDVLCAAWAPTSVDTDLDICLPGMGTVRWTGRPRGVDLDLDLFPQAAARARLVFDALDPNGEPAGS